MSTTQAWLAPAPHLVPGRLVRADSGQATVETAFAIAALCAVLVLIIGAITTVTTHLSATSIASQIARATARGDTDTADALANQLPDATVHTSTTAGMVMVDLTVEMPLLDVHAHAVALDEESA
ncbi:pilus assembly protein TadE [Corynebacterium sp. TAE3-ERU12]|uniref:TadE family type IV pilus minor pilin n=1 Tax=Corynebacterium sp. TAE3-ERU12 TaxID=2849491 RepID=UPI001C47F99F|nr:TadE family type IV pilus minor pilin [Corynebacterium sp. TAE3-ERU12]MBV7294492.1 pilus assembly protein TadE [Corynebacterium sp. TAE3-ERU12]